MKKFETDANSQFTYNVNFNDRFGPVDPPPPTGTVKVSTYRYGEALDT